MSKNWGKTYWDVFHTLSVKLKSDEKAGELFNILKQLSSLLPCPICSADSIIFFSKYNSNIINTRNKLIDLCFIFHNNVNVKLQKAVYLKENVIPTYNNNSTGNIINKFMNMFVKYSKQKLNINTMSIIFFNKQFITFINNNKHHFMA
jgi:hypothetical protein